MKKSSIICIIILITMVIVGCSSNKDSDVDETKKLLKTEYTMSEFEELLKPVYDSVKEKAEFLTEDELEESIQDLFVEECKKQGLPVGEKIKIRGKVHDVWMKDEYFIVTISSKTVDDDYEFLEDYPVSCELIDCPEAVFFKENDVIVVEGTFLQKNDLECLMHDCEIKSPAIKIPKFKNNVETIIDNACDTYSSYLDDLVYFETDVEIQGIVSNEHDISSQEMKKSAKEVFENNEKMGEYIDDNNYIYLVMSDDDIYGVWIFSKDNIFEPGDKVYILTSFMDGCVINSSGERTVVVFGKVSEYDRYYIYD